ncbi:MAG: hypothetical protein HY820_44385 [Acidobacteria bacterium]|nr:hypothetical protein [Acidobacteriota bacterium]
MGITINYKGALDDPSRINEALKEIRAFCKRVGWSYTNHSEHISGVELHTQEEADGVVKIKPRKDDPWPEEKEKSKFSLRARVSRKYPPPLVEEVVRGVLVHAPGTETLRLVFNKKGRLCHHMELPVEVIIDALPDTIHYMAMPGWVKTTGAVESHQKICELLHMLKEQFMSKLQVSDGTGYFKTGNLKKLRQEHGMMSGLIDFFSDPRMLNPVLRMAGLPEVAKDTKVATNVDIPAPPMTKPRKRKPS